MASCLLNAEINSIANINTTYSYYSIIRNKINLYILHFISELYKLYNKCWFHDHKTNMLNILFLLWNILMHSFTHLSILIHSLLVFSIQSSFHSLPSLPGVPRTNCDSRQHQCGKQINGDIIIRKADEEKILIVISSTETTRHSSWSMFEAKVKIFIGIDMFKTLSHVVRAGHDPLRTQSHLCATCRVMNEIH